MLLYLILNFIVFIIIEKYLEKWKNLLRFIQFLINISFYIIKYRNYIYYSIFILFSSIICITYFVLTFQFSKNHIENYLVYFLLLLSVLTFISVTLSKYYIYENDENEAPIGDKGKIGLKGHDGEQAKILNSLDLCVNYIMHSGDNILKEYIKNKPDLIERVGENDKIYKNIFMKRKIKEICSSNQFNNLKSKKGEFNALKTLEKISEKWIKIILNYEQGFNFLNNYFYIDKTWEKLLSKNTNLNEKISPFSIINNDIMWNW